MRSPSCPFTFFYLPIHPKNALKRYFPGLNDLENGCLKMWVDSVHDYKKEMEMN